VRSLQQAEACWAPLHCCPTYQLEPQQRLDSLPTLGVRRCLAEAEARRYEALSEAERDAIWNEGVELLEADAQGDEIELPARDRSAR
jgi:hypothetical protein